MRCPFCSSLETRVIDTRLANKNDVVRRRRECLQCVERFYTLESVEYLLPCVVKANGNREPFDESKLRMGVLRALEKRPVKTEDIENALHHIVGKAWSSGDREIKSLLIGEWVMAELRQLDEVAYVRFASVYRRFQDVHDFQEEIERMEQEPSPEAQRQQMPLLPDEVK